MMVSIVAVLTNTELFSYLERMECEGFVKGVRHDVKCAVLGST